jgi:hypothetical protein
MPIFFMSGAEMQDTSMWTYFSGSVSTSRARPGAGSCSFYFTGAGQYAELTVPARSEIWLQFAFRRAEPASGEWYLFRIFSGATELLRINSDVAAPCKYYSGAGATLLGAGVVPIRFWLAGNEWHVVELHYKLADAPDGVLESWVDGVPDLLFYGDTKPGAETTFTALRFTVAEAASKSGNFDDILISDTAMRFYGASVTGLAPISAGNYSQWTPSVGSNYSCVDEIPFVGTDYVKTATLNNIDTYTFEDLPAEAAEVLAVSTGLLGIYRQSGPSAASIAAAFRMGVADAVSGLSTALSFNSKSVIEFFPTSPVTGVAWTVSDVNSTEFGVKALS